LNTSAQPAYHAPTRSPADGLAAVQPDNLLFHCAGKGGPQNAVNMPTGLGRQPALFPALPNTSAVKKQLAQDRRTAALIAHFWMLNWQSGKG
jgi:hypothetical protein